MEEYAREVFPLEEAANGLRWMEEDGDGDSSPTGGNGSWNGQGIGVGAGDAATGMNQGEGREEKVATGTTGGGITTSSEFGGSC